MNILWLCNACPSFVNEEINEKKCNTMGWLDTIGAELSKTELLSIVYPGFGKKRFINGNLSAYSFSRKFDDKYKIKKLVQEFELIISEIKPDIIHIHGTEFAHSYSMTLAAENLGVKDRVVISIQGLVSVIAQHFFAGLSSYVIHSITIKDFLKRSNVFLQKKSFDKRGRYEQLALKNCNHIIGRTDWDRACTYIINSTAEYHFCNETLRRSFYGPKWRYSDCEKHSIFVSQSLYPIKGFHTLLSVLPIIKEEFPDVKVYVTGTDPFKIPFYRIGAYQKYLKKLILKNNLQNNVFFLGELNERQMLERYLKSNVFLLCSSIENSPNSLGEAMLLGMPIVSTDVGGVVTMAGETDVDFYPFNEPYIMAYKIISAFKSKKINSSSEICRAEKTHNINENYNTILKIYNEINKTPNNK